MPFRLAADAMTSRDFPLPLPTARCAWLAAAAALPVAAGAFAPALAWAGLVALALLSVVALVEWTTLPRARDLRVERVERAVLSQGDEETLDVDVRLVTGAAVTARAIDDLADGLDRLADPPETRLAPDEPARFSTRVRAARRGAAALGAFHLRWRGGLGLVERQARFDLPQEIRVHPGVRAVMRAAQRVARGRHEESGARRSRRRGEGTSFESLSEFVRGDDPRFIDWKASAKHAKLIARRFEVERNQNVMLMVDCGRWMTSEIGGMTRLDHALAACVLLARTAAMRDDRVGLLAFADEPLAYVPPTKGRAAVEAILRATSEIEPRLVESDYAGAFAHLASRHRKRSLVVLFTDVMSKDSGNAVVAECARGARRHLPLAVTLRDVDLDAIAGAVPKNAAAAYRQAAAEELLLEREQSLVALRRAGVQVLDVAPTSLGPAVVERYLDVKSRSLV